MIEQFEVRNHWTNAVQFTAEISVTPDMTQRVKLGLAVMWGIKTNAILAGAFLANANLANANLADANLEGAFLVDANLANANLANANLADANLAGAFLADANLANANLEGAFLVDANLADANLAGAFLENAILEGANLADAFLADAKWRDGVPLTRAPIQIHGLRWPVTILDAHMVIGCQAHRLAEWDALDNRAIADMDGRHALKFWSDYKDILLGLARADGRDFSPARENDNAHT